jgi:hypothetical protein
MFICCLVLHKAVRAEEERASLITSIRLLHKDVGCTQPSNANEAVTAHADQQLISKHHPDANDADSSYYVTIPTKNGYSPLLDEEPSFHQTNSPASKST